MWWIFSAYSADGAETEVLDEHPVGRQPSNTASPIVDAIIYKSAFKDHDLNNLVFILFWR